jgi:hypothetical protein
VAVVAVVALAAATTKTLAAIAMVELTDNNQPKAAEEDRVRTMRTTGEDGNNNGWGQRQQQGQRQWGQRRRRQGWPARTVRTTGKDDDNVKADNIEDDGNNGEDNRQGQWQQQGRWQQGRRRRRWGQGGGSGKIGGEVGGVARSEVWLVAVFFAVGCLALTYHRNRTDTFGNKFILVINSIRHVRTCQIEFILFVEATWLSCGPEKSAFLVLSIFVSIFVDKASKTLLIFSSVNLRAEESYNFKISLPCLVFIPASVDFFHLSNYWSIFLILLGAALKLRCCFKRGDAVLKL